MTYKVQLEQFVNWCGISVYKAKQFFVLLQFKKQHKSTIFSSKPVWLFPYSFISHKHNKKEQELKCEALITWPIFVILICQVLAENSHVSYRTGAVGSSNVCSNIISQELKQYCLWTRNAPVPLQHSKRRFQHSLGGHFSYG